MFRTVLFGAVLIVGLVATKTPAQAPAFEVASIKLQTLSIPGQMIGQQGDRFVARNVTVRELIETAYQVPSEQISGGPEWTESDRTTDHFTITGVERPAEN